MSRIRDMLNRLLYKCSTLVPRAQHRWVFIGWHIGSEMETFADNTKYLFLHVANGCPDLRPVWLAKDRKLAELLRSRGYTSYYQKSFRGIYEALRAGTTVIDAFFQPENFRWSGGTRLVQLLHGRGMKKIGYSIKPPRNHDFICTPSPFVESLLPAVFTEGAKIFHTGYPRNDVLFRTIENSDISTDEHLEESLRDSRAAGVHTILYAPTFRRGEKEFGLDSKFDLDSIDAWLEKIHARLYITLHPKYRNQSRKKEYARIYFVEDSDIYPFLSLFDLLVADYTSLIYDFLLLDRPIVFFPYDLKEYSEKEGLAFPYDSHTPGPKAYDVDLLMTTITSAFTNDTYREERARVRALYHTHQDGHSSERIMRHLAEAELS